MTAGYGAEGGFSQGFRCLSFIASAARQSSSEGRKDWITALGPQ
jgi:hypothetical protein